MIKPKPAGNKSKKGPAKNREQASSNAASASGAQRNLHAVERPSGKRRIAKIPADLPLEQERDVQSMDTLSRRPIAGPAAGVTPGEGGTYVYGIIEAVEPANFGRTGLGGGGEQVYTVHHGDIAAVVSKTTQSIFDPTRENALAHEHVIESVMKSHTIIPMSFGTVFRTDDDIREVLKSIYNSLQDVLKQMAGKFEFGVKVTWDRDQIVEELKRDDEEIHRFHIELTKKHLQSTYFARMQLGRMIDKALGDRSADFVRRIYEALRPVCVASRDNKAIGDKMIMNAAFLIQREREEEFDAAVNRIAKKFGDRLNFKYTGPWPPYNFVNIRLKLERGTAS
jgi:hypothetical protein